MEFIGVLVLLFFAWVILNWLLETLAKIFGSKNKTRNNNQSMTYNKIGDFEIRLTDTKLNNSSDAPTIKEVQCRGLFPIHSKKNVGTVISVFDNTSENPIPVISVLEEFQEKNNVVYQHRNKIGFIEPTQGFVDWVNIGPVIPDIIQTPYRGNRKIEVLVRLIDLNNPPRIMHGFRQNGDSGILWLGRLKFDWEFAETGFEEAAKNREESIAIALKIGLAVAMADNSLDNKEGSKLKNWIIKNIQPYTGNKKEELRSIYNNALSEGYRKAKKGELDLESLTSRLNEVGEKKHKYEAIEFCYEIMAADGIANKKELNVIKNIAQSLGLDVDQVNAMRDKKIVSLSSESTSGANIEELLDISKDWDSSKIRKHLRLEFNKWNNRLNTLPEGNKRQNAQKMLDLISEAKKKYD